MIKLTIDNTEYLHPSKIEEVTLRQWIAINDIEEDTSLSHIENNIKAFSAFSGVPVAKLSTLPKKDLLYYISITYEMVGKVDLTDNVPPKTFKVGRSTFIVNKNIDDCEVSQYLDSTHYMKLLESSPSFYPYMMAIYCLKKREKYNSGKYDMAKRVEQMLDANVLDALKINAFFLITSQDYQNDTRLYLAGNQAATKSKQVV